MHNLLTSIPLNMLQWLLGAGVLAVFSYKSWVGYQHSGNRLSYLFIWFSALAGLSLLAYGSSAFVQPDYNLAFRLHLLGDFWLYACLVAQAHILVLLQFNGSARIRNWLVLAVVVLGSLALYGAAMYGSVVPIDGLLLYRVPMYVAGIRGLLIAGLFVPLGWLFVRKIGRLSSLPDQLKAGTIGLTYTGIGVSTLYRDWVLGGLDTQLFATGNILFFTLLLISLLLYEPRQVGVVAKSAPTASSRSR